MGNKKNESTLGKIFGLIGFFAGLAAGAEADLRYEFISKLNGKKAKYVEINRTQEG